MSHSALSRRSNFSPIFGRDVFDLFDRFFSESTSPVSLRRDAEPTERPSWVPPVDLRETEEAFVVSAELPGLSKDEIDISLDDGVLTLAGERRFEKESENDNYHRVERSYGSFRRAFTLPKGIDESEVKATFENGLVTLTLPKTPAAKPRKIALG